MSTQFKLHAEGMTDLILDERSAKWDLDLDDPGDYRTIFYNLTHEEVLKIATKMIYAVWCHYPDEADERVAQLANDIPRTVNRMAK